MEKSEMELLCKELFFKTLENVVDLHVDIQSEPEMQNDSKMNISVRVKRSIPSIDQVENNLRNALEHNPEK